MLDEGKRSRREAFVRTIAGCLLMAALGTLYSWSVFVPALEAEFGPSRAIVSAVFSLATVSFTIGMIFAPGFEKLGPAGIRAVLSCAVAAAGLTLAALSASYLQFLIAFGVLFGLANGLGYSVSLSIVQAAPAANRGLLTGIVVATYMAGSAIASPLLLASLTASGLRSTLLLLAAVIIAAGLIVSALMRGMETGPKPRDQATVARRVVLSRPEFLRLWSCFFFSSAVGVMAIAHAAPLVASLSGSAGQIGWAATVVAAGNGIGRLVGGWLTDRFSPRSILSGAPAMSLLAVLSILLMRHADGALVSLALLGISYGAIASGLPSIIARYYGAANLSVIYGRLFTAWGAAGLIGPLVGGAFFDAFGDYRSALIASGVAALLAAISGFAYRAPVGQLHAR